MAATNSWMFWCLPLELRQRIYHLCRLNSEAGEVSSGSGFEVPWPVMPFFQQFNSDTAQGQPVDDPTSADEYVITADMLATFPGITSHGLPYSEPALYREYVDAYDDSAGKEPFTAHRMTASGDIWIMGDIVLRGSEIGICKYGRYSFAYDFLPLSPVRGSVLADHLRDLPLQASRIRLHVARDLVYWNEQCSRTFLTLKRFEKLRELEIVLHHRPVSYIGPFWKLCGQLSQCKHLEELRFRFPDIGLVEVGKSFGSFDVKGAETIAVQLAQKVSKEDKQRLQHSWKVNEVRRQMEIRRRQVKK